MATQPHTPHHHNVLDWLFHRSHNKPETPTHAQNPVRDINDALQSNLRWLDGVLVELQERISGAPGASTAQLTLAERREMERERRMREQRQRFEAARRHMRGQVLTLHQQFGTGIQESDLEMLAVFIERLAPVLDAPEPSSLVASAHAAILRRIYHETGEIAWRKLFDAMERAGTSWPLEPHCVSDRAKERAREDAHHLFVHSRAGCTAALISGVVKAWTIAYPRENGIIWHQVALRGVAAGVRARLMMPCVDHLQRDRVWILAEFRELVELQTDIVQGELSRGVHSASESDRVVAGVKRLMEQVLPGLVWRLVRQAIEEDLPSPVAS